MDRDGDKIKLKSLSSFQKFQLKKILREKFYVLMKSTLKIIALTDNEFAMVPHLGQ